MWAFFSYVCGLREYCHFWILVFVFGFFFFEKLAGSHSFPLFPLSFPKLYFFCVYLCCRIYTIVFFLFILGCRCNRLTSGNQLKADVSLIDLHIHGRIILILLSCAAINQVKFARIRPVGCVTWFAVHKTTKKAF